MLKLYELNGDFFFQEQDLGGAISFMSFFVLVGVIMNVKRSVRPRILEPSASVDKGSLCAFEVIVSQPHRSSF